MSDRCDLSDLCDELAGSTDTEFAKTYGGEPPSRVLLSHGSLRVLADLSPLALGHLLVVPVQHYLNFAEFTAGHPGELDGLSERIRTHYEEAFGGAVYLEHGSSSDMRNSACINHAHLHMLPLQHEDVLRMMRGDGLIEERIEELEMLSQHAGRDEPYFLVSDTRSASIFGLGRRMEKQYLRHVAARILELEPDTFDWAIYIRRDLCRETIERLHHLRRA